MGMPVFRIGCSCIAGGHHVATFGFPRLGYSIAGAGVSREDAVHRAATAAEGLLDFLSEHPELPAAALGPQAVLAVKAVKLISYLIKKGYARDAAEAVQHIASQAASAAVAAEHEGEAVAHDVGRGIAHAASAVESTLARIF